MAYHLDKKKQTRASKTANLVGMQGSNRAIERESNKARGEDWNTGFLDSERCTIGIYKYKTAWQGKK